MIDNDKNIAFWNREAEQSRSTDKAFAGMRMSERKFAAIYRCEAEQDRLLSIFSPSPTSKILEIGSGGGRWGYFFADKVGSYLGLDISPNMIEISEEERVRRNLHNIRFECCDLLDFDTEERYDLVYFSGVLQYIDDDVIEQCVAKASSLLAQDGVIISRDSIQTLERVEKVGEYPVIYRTEGEYRSLFQNGDFEMDYSNLSYDHKRFTGMASRLYEIPGVTYNMAIFAREILCKIDNLFGKPGFLKTNEMKKIAEQENPQEHRFFKYVRQS